MKTYLVGGAVRDRLLGLPVKDHDWVVTGATPEQMTDLGYRPVGRDFPVFLHPETREEYALARTERKSGRGYHGFVFHTSPEVTLEQDLARRDLTINAMAQDEDGHIIDPYNGRQDLEQGILRHVSPAFSEDPVRLLRIARYATRYAERGFRIAPETLQLLQGMVADGEVDSLVAERVWNELDNALRENRPSVFFNTLRSCGALTVLLPEIDRLFGVPQPARHHPEIDTGVHTMMVIDMAAQLGAQAEVRFAALCHDLGKGTTNPDILPRHTGHEKRGVRLIEQLCQRLSAPKRYAELARLVCLYHTHCHRAGELRPSTLLKVLEALDVFRRPERLDAFLTACEADSRGRLNFEQQSYPQAGIFRAAYQAARRIDINDLVEAGVSGDEIQETLRKRRIRAIGMNQA
jgi:tRNA nucleotidyltransferase (CCA-adding enzyme)